MDIHSQYHNPHWRSTWSSGGCESRKKTEAEKSAAEVVKLALSLKKTKK